MSYGGLMLVLLIVIDEAVDKSCFSVGLRNCSWGWSSWDLRFGSGRLILGLSGWWWCRTLSLLTGQLRGRWGSRCGGRVGLRWG